MIETYTILFASYILSVFAYSQNAPSNNPMLDSALPVVEEVILDALSFEDDVKENPALVRKWNRAREKIVELGPQADLAVAVIIVKGLKAKREAAILNEERKKNWRNNPAPESPTVANLERLIRLVRNDPALVPILLRPLSVWWDEFAAGAVYSFSRTEEEAALYLYKWGDAAMQKHISQQAETLAKSGDPSLASMGDLLQNELQNPTERVYPPPKGPFHEWCRERLEWDKQWATAGTGTGIQVPGKESPHPESPESSRPTPQPGTPKPPVTESLSTLTHGKAWIVWLVVILGGTGGAYWFTKRKSKNRGSQ